MATFQFLTRMRNAMVATLYRYIFFCTVTRDECGGFGEEEVSVTGKRDIPIHMWLVDSSKSE